MLWVKMSLGDLKDWIMVSDTFNITALIIWIVRTIIYIFFIGIKQTVYIKPMITRVPVSISVGTRGTRELLMSLLVEALHRRPESKTDGATTPIFPALSYRPRAQTIETLN